MLRYNIRVDGSNVEMEEMSWGEKFLSQDLSYVSGTTSASYSLGKYDRISASNNLVSSDATLAIESNDVTINGYIVIKMAQHKIKSFEKDGATINYIEYNGKYYYENDGNYVIENFLTIADGKPSHITKSFNASNDAVEFDEIRWIEDMTVTISGDTYDYDINSDAFMLDGNGVILPNVEAHVYGNDNWRTITKFVARKFSEHTQYDYSSLRYCSYIYYIIYDGKPYEVTDDGTKFICKINEEEKSLYFRLSSDSSGEYIELTQSNLSANGINDVYDLYTLRNVSSYVKLSCDGKDEYFEVKHDVITSQDGSRILLTIGDQYTSVGVGDILTLSDATQSSVRLKVWDDKFVIYNGSIYYIVNNLCDTVTIADTEYDIHYPNGKAVNTFCYVVIGESNVSMNIVLDGGELKLKRDGAIVTDNGKIATDSILYSINNYGGISINGVNYRKHPNEDYIEVPLSPSYKLVVTDTVGSSTFVCDIDIDGEQISNATLDIIRRDIMQEILASTSHYSLSGVNKIFGVREITPQLPFLIKKRNSSDVILSSDYYYDLFDNLKLYMNSGFLMVKIPMSMNVGGDAIQDNVVENNFFEYQKKLAINPIIDMEKDVYSPMYFDGKYAYSDTMFNPISEIRFNLHFRTRDLSNWKVNEGYNLADTSGKTDGWFITDYEPYKSMNTSNLLDHSDLMGLLYFTNDDIYYQKNKVSKSFLRLSYYDSIDPQKQNLLATSTIFMDEHSMYKKYIDNSRKNINTYTIVSESSSGLSEQSKIGVMTEIGKKGSITSLNEDARISSRFTVSSKYDTDTSSEGFYIYMFKEYSDGLRPKQIFMKVEFNHAGVGSIIPFIKPMSWNLNGFPTKALQVGASEFKKGIRLETKYAQDYIPLYAVYDFKDKCYSYVFDDRYADRKDDIVTLNLFEPKIMDENSYDASQNSIEYSINFNDNQFKK